MYQDYKCFILLFDFNIDSNIKNCYFLTNKQIKLFEGKHLSRLKLHNIYGFSWANNMTNNHNVILVLMSACKKSSSSSFPHLSSNLISAFPSSSS